MTLDVTNKKEQIISIICHSIAATVLLALLIVASFFDLKISQAIGNQQSFFGVLFQKIAEYPQYLVLPITSVIVFFNNNSFVKKWQQVAIKCVGVILGFGGWFLFSFQSEKLVQIPHLLEFSLFFAVILTIVGLLIGKLIPKPIINKLFKWAIFAVCVAAVSLILAQGLKLIWHRMRFRDMLAEGNFEGFTQWYVINPFRGKLNEAYHYSSFPSGHTTSAVHIFLIMPLFDIFDVKNKRIAKFIANSCCAIFVVLTMFARIVNCAHFLSDVVVATILTYSVYYTFKVIFFGTSKNHNYYFVESNIKKD